jgi:hypothetical protein
MAFSTRWLPQVLRDAGLEVLEHGGWQNRGHGDMGAVQGVRCHHTCGPPADLAIGRVLSSENQRSRRASRLDVSQRLPPIFSTSA